VSERDDAAVQRNDVPGLRRGESTKGASSKVSYRSKSGGGRSFDEVQGAE